MPYHWNPQLKAEAIQLLVEHLGSTYFASKATGIPERTIQEWKNEFQQVNTLLLEQEPENELERVIYARYQQLRNDLLEHIGKLSELFRANPAQASDLAIAMARLIDRLHKLEKILQPRQFAIIILYEHPDGTIREKPSAEVTQLYKQK